MKRCTRCQEEKALSEFYHREGKPRSRCKSCWNLWKTGNVRKPAWYVIRRRAFAQEHGIQVPGVIQCLECGADAEVRYLREVGRKRFCSRSCKAAWAGKNRDPVLLARMAEARLRPDVEAKRLAALKRGSEHPMWVDGRAATQRPKAQMRAWREAVFSRDDYTCQSCGEKGGRLQADHIMPYSTHPDLRWEVTNGRTMCVECHKRTPTYGGKFAKQARLLLMGRV